MPRSARPSVTAADRRSACPLACALDLLGDRWTLLVIRDIVEGKTRYGEFAESAEGIPTNILAERLQRLEGMGLIKRAPYQRNPPRYSYSLTAKGEELKPVLGTLATWAIRHVPHTKPSEKMNAMLEAHFGAKKLSPWQLAGGRPGNRLTGSRREKELP